MDINFSSFPWQFSFYFECNCSYVAGSINSLQLPNWLCGCCSAGSDGSSRGGVGSIADYDPMNDQFGSISQPRGQHQVTLDFGILLCIDQYSNLLRVNNFVEYACFMYVDEYFERLLNVKDNSKASIIVAGDTKRMSVLGEVNESELNDDGVDTYKKQCMKWQQERHLCWMDAKLSAGKRVALLCYSILGGCQGRRMIFHVSIVQVNFVFC